MNQVLDIEILLSSPNYHPSSSRLGKKLYRNHYYFAYIIPGSNLCRIIVFHLDAVLVACKNPTPSPEVRPTVPTNSSQWDYTWWYVTLKIILAYNSWLFNWNIAFCTKDMITPFEEYYKHCKKCLEYNARSAFAPTKYCNSKPELITKFMLECHGPKMQSVSLDNYLCDLANKKTKNKNRISSRLV